MSAVARVWWICLGAFLSFVFVLFAIYNHRTAVVDVFFRRYEMEVWALAAVSWVVGFTVPAFFVLAYRLDSLRRERQLRNEIATLATELTALRNVALTEPLGESVERSRESQVSAALPPAGRHEPRELSSVRERKGGSK